MIVSIFLCAFIIYYFIIFSNNDVIFLLGNKKWKFRISIIIISGLLFYLYYLFSFHESVLFIIFVILIFVEFYIEYNHQRLRSIFGTLCYATNFFAIRLVIMSLYTLCTKQPFNYFITNIEANMKCTILSFIVCSLYVVGFRYILTNHHINIIRNNDKNIRFITKILLCLFIFQIFNTINGYVTQEYILLPWLQLEIGICMIITFCVTLLYVYLLNRIDSSIIMETESSAQQMESQQLDGITYIEKSLDCYSQVYGLRYLEDMIHINQTCFSIVYFKINGLTTIKNKYGNIAGDTYMKNVVDILKNIFQRQIVCYMKEDELMVVLRDTDEFSACKMATRVSESIELENRKMKQPYRMSISYTVLEINRKNMITTNQILKIIDEKMVF